jgi:hypothetical protein
MVGEISPGVLMRVSDSILDTIVFLGYPSNAPSKGGIDCIGTGFLLVYDYAPYLVTVRHVAEQFGNDPFLIRVNRFDRTGENIHLDRVRWFFDKNPTVDVAILPLDLQSKYAVRYIDDSSESWWWNKARKYGAGIADFVYTVGLFRVLAGVQRNMPVVHFGTIARVPDPANETIPIRDWRDRTGEAVIQTNSYLVETHSLAGLSGAPVFLRATNCMVRPEMIEDNPQVSDVSELGDAVAMWKLHLIGMWQGSWDAAPDHVLGLEHGKEARVPVGMGVVIPIDHVHYALEGDELKDLRNDLKKKAAASSAASLDSAPRSEKVSPRASDENPTHREDFNSLVAAAARKPERED